jgi:acetyltransferase-like isoleucine patch superfamily enzyme
MDSSSRLPHDWFPQPLPGNVQIGAKSWLYSSFAFVHYRSQSVCGVRIGNNSGIYNGTFFDLDVNGEVLIGDYCTLVGAVIATRGRVVIDDYVFISHEVTIADHFTATPPGARREPHDPPPRGEILIGQGAWIGARAVILSGARIGKGAIVGAACVVNTEVPPFTTVAGNPSRIVGRSREA